RKMPAARHPWRTVRTYSHHRAGALRDLRVARQRLSATVRRIVALFANTTLVGPTAHCTPSQSRPRASPSMAASTGAAHPWAAGRDWLGVRCALLQLCLLQLLFARATPGSPPSRR